MTENRFIDIGKSLIDIDKSLYFSISVNHNHRFRSFESPVLVFRYTEICNSKMISDGSKYAYFPILVIRFLDIGKSF